jgi:hypothetical protein
MKRNPTKITKKVTVLTDPQPSFNSLVGAGANGTPLRVIKTEEITQEAPMAKNLKNGNADIAKLVFRGEKFKTEAEVQTWLTTGNYVETTIKSEDDGSFTVEGNADLTNVQEIEVEDGVLSYVGEAAAPVDDTAKADVTAMDGKKTEAPTTGAQKSDDELRVLAEEKVRTEAKISESDWKALKQETRDKFTAPVLEAMKAELAAAPAAEVVQPVATGAAPEAAKSQDAELPKLLAKDENGLLTVVSQKSCYELSTIADVISSLSYLKNNALYDAFFEGAEGTDDASLANSIRAVINQLGNILIQVAQNTVAEASKSEAAPESTTKKTTEATQEEVVAANAAKTETPANEASNSDPVQNALLEAIKGLTTTVDGLRDEVKTAKDAAEQSAKKADTLAERLEKVETTPQTRKSADVEELSYVSPIVEQAQATKSSSEISAEVRKTSGLSAFGIRT